MKTALLCALLVATTARAEPRPIVDTHIHLYEVSRPGGVPWPPAKNRVLYRDMRPADYKAVARKHGIIATGIVEASNLFADNGKVLALVAGDPFFRFLIAQIEIGASDFGQQLDELARDPRFVGVRAFLWSPKLTLEPAQLRDLRELARRGLSLDLISRGDLNPKTKVAALAAAVPDLRIIIDHLAGARGKTPDPSWVADMKTLAAHPNVHMKFSSFLDMYAPAGGGHEPWKAPADVAAYRPHFDVLWSTFGPDRLIWGSNWPVTEMAGGFAQQVRIAEDYLRAKGPEARDKVMYQNAERFYRRIPRD